MGDLPLRSPGGVSSTFIIVSYFSHPVKPLCKKIFRRTGGADAPEEQTQKNFGKIKKSVDI
jgi:hypothetical protein